MIRNVALGVLLSLALATGGAAQPHARIAVAVPTAETSDHSLRTAADRLTTALRATVGLTGTFELYDTSLTSKSAGRLPTQYICVSRVSPAIPGWVQATISFVDSPLKDPVVRLSIPVLLNSDVGFSSLARLAWERLAKAERKRLDSLRTR